MADTTRVTVPVEDLAGKLKAIRDKFLMPTPDKDFTDYAIMTRCVEALSAAPAPEGMVAHYGDPCVKCGVGHDDVSPGPCRDDGITISRERANALLSYLKNGRGPAGWPTTLWCEVQAFIKNIDAAIAPREEAPAEAGELDSAIRRMRNQLVGSATFERLMFGREDARAVLDALEALRAKPPAREDAQPVQLGWSDDEWGVASRAVAASRSSHPAPDALRVAVEALVEAREDLFVKADKDEMPEQWASVQKIDQALAALQAEQGTK